MGRTSYGGSFPEAFRVRSHGWWFRKTCKFGALRFAMATGTQDSSGQDMEGVRKLR